MPALKTNEMFQTPKRLQPPAKSRLTRKKRSILRFCGFYLLDGGGGADSPPGPPLTCCHRSPMEKAGWAASSDRRMSGLKFFSFSGCQRRAANVGEAAKVMSAILS